MNMKLKSLRTSATLIVLLAVSLLTFSCNSFDERLPECRLLVKFKYDYNMLHTDAFHTQVDRVELYIFDKDGSMGGIIILPTLAKKMCALLANVN